MKKSILILAGLASLANAALAQQAPLVVRDTGIATSSFVYDAQRNLIYAASANTATIAVVNPRSGTIIRSFAIPQVGSNLALSDDDSKLYFSFGGTVDRIDIATKQIDQSFSVSSGFGANVQGLSVRPGHKNTVAVQISQSAGLPFPAYGIGVFKNGVSEKTFSVSFGTPALLQIKFSHDGNTVFGALDNSVVGYPYTTGGFSGTVTTYPSPQFLPLQLDKAKLFVGPSAFNQKTADPVGAFAVTTSVWLLAPEERGNYGVAFTCGANGESPTLDVVNTARFQDLKSFPVTGIPATFNGGVGSLKLAGKTVAFTLFNPTTFATTLAFFDRETNILGIP